MAQLSVYSVDFRDVTFSVSGLENLGNLYDKFVFRIYQNEIRIIQYTVDDTSWCSSKNFTFTFENPGYAGYNWLSPNCKYVAYVDCYWDGVCYTLNSVSFRTDGISPPSGTIEPSVYVPIREQEYGTCVANSLACAMDIFKAINTGIGYEKFSAAYIFGSDGIYQDWMYFEGAVDNCISYGSPRYEIFSGFFPDELPKSEAIDLYNSADVLTKNNARKQRLCQKKHVDFYDCDTVKECIDLYGYFMLNIRVPNNFYNIDSDGIVPQPDWYTGENHSIALIGLTTKNGKKHWIAQNSWGESWGAGGRCFIPYDWGCGVQSPISSSYDEPTSWTLDCYSVQGGTGYTDDNPTEPYNLKVQQIGTTKSADVSWDCDTPADSYVVLVKQRGTNRWYMKTTVSTKSTTVNLDYFGSYDFCVITVDNYYCSDISNIVYTVISETQRPKNFYWTFPKEQGADFVLTKNEWNSFTSSINEFRNYWNEKHKTDLSDYDFTLAVKGADFTATMYRQARSAIQEMSGYGSNIPYVEKGDPVTAYSLNILISELNAIP